MTEVSDVIMGVGWVTGSVEMATEQAQTARPRQDFYHSWDSFGRRIKQSATICVLPSPGKMLSPSACRRSDAPAIRPERPFVSGGAEAGGGGIS